MAKTIMVSEKIYKELKSAKGMESFSELLSSLLYPKEKKGGALKDCLGLLKGDSEYDTIFKKLSKEWKAWSRRYA